jgi:hypothetical protein
LLAISVCSGCALGKKTRTVFVPEGDPVIIAEDLKGVRVLVRDGQGRLYYDKRDIPEGWVALPVPEVRSANELPAGKPVEKWEQ